jgi:hypothetical protein
MIVAAAAVLGAFAAVDWYALDGKYTHAALAIAHSLRQHFLGL